MAMQIINDAKFGEAVLNASIPVLLTFRASHCKQSLQMAQVIGEIAKEFDNQAHFFEVNADQDTEMIQREYDVRRLPVTILLENGRPVDFIGGLVPKKSVTEMIKRRLSPVLQVDEFDFDVEVLKSQKPVIVHFDAAWCKQSQTVAKLVTQAAQKLRGEAKFVRVNFGPENARICAQFGVKRVPTVSLFVEGEVKDQLFGGVTESVKSAKERNVIEEMLKPVL
jgi:thioredoxin 1